MDIKKLSIQDIKVLIDNGAKAAEQLEKDLTTKTYEYKPKMKRKTREEIKQTPEFLELHEMGEKRRAILNSIKLAEDELTNRLIKVTEPKDKDKPAPNQLSLLDQPNV